MDAFKSDVHAPSPETGERETLSLEVLLLTGNPLPPEHWVDGVWLPIPLLQSSGCFLGVTDPGRRSGQKFLRWPWATQSWPFRPSGDWTFFEKSGGRVPPVPLRARYGRKKLAQGQRRAGARDRRPTECRPG